MGFLAAGAAGSPVSRPRSRQAANYVICFALDRLGRDVAGLLEWTASAVGRGVEVHVCARGRLDATSASGFGTALGVGLADPYPAYLRHSRDRDVLNLPGVVLYGLRSSKSGRLPQKIIRKGQRRRRTLRVAGFAKVTVL